MFFKKRIGNVITMVFMLAVLGISTAEAAIEWQWVNPTPQGNDLNGVVYNGSNQYVAVGDFGTVLTSVDSYTWINGSAGTTKALNDIIWNGTQYLAVGDAGVVVTSMDGVTWVASSANTTLNINAVIWDGVQYVAVGQSGRVWTSVDGVTWAELNLATTSWLKDIVWTGTQYVAIGQLGVILTSADAITWVQQTSPLTGGLNGIAWNGSLFVIVGDSAATMSSPDGITWTSIVWTVFAYSLQDIAWDGTQFVAIVGSAAYVSVDGNWGTATYTGNNRIAMSSIYPAAGAWIAVGTGGSVFTNLNATTWVSRIGGMQESIEALVNNGSLVLALGEQCGFMTSTNGINWNIYASAMPASNACGGAVWDSVNSRFVAITSFAGAVGNVYVSPDGVNWTLVSTAGPFRSRAVAYSPTAGFVAVGSPDFVTGEIWSSPDAITWTKQAVANALNDVVWANNQFVTVGNNGAIHTSPDGITWTTQVSGTAASLYDVNANATTYLAAGSSSTTVFTSIDGISWLPQTTGLAAAAWSGDIVWTGDQFLVSGTANLKARMMSSADGINWTENNLITSAYLGHLDIFAGKVLAGGSAGVIISGTNIDVVTTISAGATEVTEGGATDSFDMVLTSAPSADVTIVPSADPEVSFVPAQMVFTTLNWNTPQTMTITAVDDAIQEPTKNILITPSVASLDARYNALVVPDIAVTVFDNDTPAVNITQSGGSTTVIEGGATDTYDIVLATLPTANVSVGLAIGQAQVTTNVNTLTFTPINWNTPQTVTITAVDDIIVEGTHSDNISHTVTSADVNYNAIAAPSLSTITITDNDVGSVLITESGGSTDIAEGGATDSFDVVLGLQPSVDVSVTLAPDFTNQCTLNLSPIVFTPLSWNIPQTIAVTAVDDGVVEGMHSCSITITPRSSSLGYHLIAVPNVNANVTDNDSIDVILTASAGSTDVTEGGITDAYDVVLNSQPQLNVTVNVVPNAQVSTNQAALAFTPANWNIAQTVTVTAIDDGIVEGAHTGVVAHNITSSDPGYAGFVVADMTVNITDNQAPVITLLGNNPLTVALGDSFTDPGYTIADDTDTGLIAIVTGAVDTSVINSYTLSYNVSDAAGNAAAQQTRTVNVVDASVVTSPASGSGGGCIAPTSSSMQQTALLFGMLVSGCLLMRRRKVM